MSPTPLHLHQASHSFFTCRTTVNALTSTFPFSYFAVRFLLLYTVVKMTMMMKWRWLWRNVKKTSVSLRVCRRPRWFGSPWPATTAVRWMWSMPTIPVMWSTHFTFVLHAFSALPAFQVNVFLCTVDILLLVAALFLSLLLLFYTLCIREWVIFRSVYNRGVLNSGFRLFDQMRIVLWTIQPSKNTNTNSVVGWAFWRCTCCSDIYHLHVPR